MGFNLVNSKFCWEISSNNSLNSSFGVSERDTKPPHHHHHPYLALKPKGPNFEKYIYFSHLPRDKNWLAIKELIPTIPQKDESVLWFRRAETFIPQLENVSILLPWCPPLHKNQGGPAPQSSPLCLPGSIYDWAFCRCPDNTVTFLTLTFNILLRSKLPVAAASLSHSVCVENQCGCQTSAEGLEPATLFPLIGFDSRGISRPLSYLQCQWSCPSPTEFPVWPCQYCNPCVCVFVFVFV